LVFFIWEGFGRVFRIYGRFLGGVAMRMEVGLWFIGFGGIVGELVFN
jgi:hypothetical protein